MLGSFADSFKLPPRIGQLPFELQDNQEFEHLETNEHLVFFPRLPLRVDRQNFRRGDS